MGLAILLSLSVLSLLMLHDKPGVLKCPSKSVLIRILTSLAVTINQITWFFSECLLTTYYIRDREIGT